VIAHKDIGR